MGANDNYSSRTGGLFYERREISSHTRYQLMQAERVIAKTMRVREQR